MEMFSSACHLGKVFDKYNSNISQIKKKNVFFPPIYIIIIIVISGEFMYRHGSVRQCSGIGKS